MKFAEMGRNSNEESNSICFNFFGTRIVAQIWHSKQTACVKPCAEPVSECCWMTEALQLGVTASSTMQNFLSMLWRNSLTWHSGKLLHILFWFWLCVVADLSFFPLSFHLVWQVDSLMPFLIYRLVGFFLGIFYFLNWSSSQEKNMDAHV